jgi:hypothetical protein
MSLLFAVVLVALAASARSDLTECTTVYATNILAASSLDLRCGAVASLQTCILGVLAGNLKGCAFCNMNSFWLFLEDSSTTTAADVTKALSAAINGNADCSVGDCMWNWFQARMINSKPFCTVATVRPFIAIEDNSLEFHTAATQV